MREQILVPLDGSAIAEKALPHAIAVAKATSKALVLVRVVVPPSPPGGVGWAVAPAVHTEMWGAWEDEQRNARDYLAEVATHLAYKGFEVQTKVVEGDPATEIAHYAEEHPQVTLIAMSTHGRSGLNLWVFGSVAEKVVHESPVPILMVRARESKRAGQPVPVDAETTTYSTIVVPLDGSPFAEQALDKAVPLASVMKARLVLVCAVPDDPLLDEAFTTFDERKDSDSEYVARAAYLREVENKLIAKGLQVETRMKYGSPEETIMTTSDEVHADLVVMTTHGRGGLKRFWLGSVATEVVRHASQPVLLVRTKQRVQEPETERSVEPNFVLSST
jgi:nucleotide-binding universal stress UspA family protein